MTNLSKRTQAREYAFKFLYRLQLEEFSQAKEALTSGSQKDAELSSAIEEFETSYNEQDIEHPDNKIAPDMKFFAHKLIKKVLENEEVLKEKVSLLLLKRTIKTLDKVDLSILLLGACELTQVEETPRTVVINEAINLAKKYGTKDSSSFVNGVLDKVKK